jgi:hypothetical protein
MKIKLKPWQLVYVDKDDQERAFIGETVSMPTLDDTIMVRTVPGHPGTAIEVRLDQVELVPAGSWWVHYACIEGKRKHFPADMLRSDQCIPVSFIVEWDEARGAHAAKTEQPTDMLVVAQVNQRRYGQWTPGRWRSFNWGITEMSSECFVQQKQEEPCAA